MLNLSRICMFVKVFHYHNFFIYTFLTLALTLLELSSLLLRFSKYNLKKLPSSPDFLVYYSPTLQSEICIFEQFLLFLHKFLPC